MAVPTPLAALLLDFGCVVTKSIFENMELVERGLGLAPGTLGWRGPLDPAGDSLWRDMQADRITERQYWAIRSAEVAELVGEVWEAYACRRGRPPSAGLPGSAARSSTCSTTRAPPASAPASSPTSSRCSTARRLDTVPALKRIDVVVDATFTKVLKPDPRAYQMGLDALQALPKETLFVDDQLRNVRGAEAVGIGALHFDICRPEEMVRQIRGRLALPSTA